MDNAGPALELENICYMIVDREAGWVETKQQWRADGNQIGIGERFPLWLFNTVRGKPYCQISVTIIPAFARPLVEPVMKKYGTCNSIVIPFGDINDPAGYITAN